VTTEPGPRHSGRRIVGQSVLLFGGYGLAQLLALLRNAMLAHLLVKDDFGVAVALTITLQVFEMLSDPAADKLIVQIREVDIGRLMATAHVLSVARGVLIGALLFVLAPLAASLFAIPDAAPAFMVLALVPVIRAGMSLDWRRAQRDLESRPAVLVELLPQAGALALTYPAVQWSGGYAAVIWITVGQALLQLAVTHALARDRYRLGFDRDWFRRIMVFTWPALISAMTLLAVFQGDRVIVSQFFGIEALAAYSVAFVLTMVPASLVGRAGTSLLVPVFAELDAQPALRRSRFLLSLEIAVVVAAGYLALFIILGGDAVATVFGPNYAGLGQLTAMLATMWALRMLQLPLTSFLLAAGEPRSLTIGGAIRASALGFAVIVGLSGGSLLVLAATGIIGEVLALVFHAWRVGRIEPGVHHPMMGRIAYVPVVAVLCWPLIDAGQWLGSGLAIATAGVTLMALGGGLLALFRDLRRRLVGLIGSSRGVRDRKLWTAAQVAESDGARSGRLVAH
jgi:O-antigen/teichoic acid export membrane protein